MTKRALSLVQTSHILFVEHDTPLVGDFPWADLLTPLVKDELDLIRFSHESNHLFELYPDLMLDEYDEAAQKRGFVRTAQWSQRPHLAKADFYRRVLNDHFEGNRTMIEDKMHGVVANAYKQRGKAGWNEYKLGVYSPKGDIKRSGNLDGRQDDPKYEDTFEL